MNGMVDAWGFWGFHAAWQAGAVAAVILAVVWLRRRLPAPIRYRLLLDDYSAGDGLVFVRSVCALDHDLVRRELAEAWLTNAQVRQSILSYNKEFSELIRLSIEADPDAREDILEFWAKSEYGELYWLLYSATPRPLSA